MITPGTLLQKRYRVSAQIGQGGMGAVYVATDERFRSTVAVKQTFFGDPLRRKAFEREAHLLNHLRHPALPRVSDHFDEGDDQFLVMEFIPGEDLAELLHARGGAFPVADVLRWADELLDALDYLHTQEPQVVHRDIKPQNLKLTPRGQIILLDFGLAKGNVSLSPASATASVFGYSRNYAPLEQIQGTGTDPRSDLYSLGATLYHMMTGVAPIDALTRAAAVVNHQPDPLRPAHLARAGVPSAVGKIIQRAMSQNAAMRPRTASEMRASLHEAANSHDGDARKHVPVPAHAGTVFIPEPSAFHVATVIDRRVAPPPDARDDSNATRYATHTRRPALDEMTVAAGGAHRDDRTALAAARRADSFTTLSPPARHESFWQSLKSPSRPLIIAAIVLAICAVSVPLLLRRSSDAAPDANSGSRNANTSGETTNAARGNASTQAPAAVSDSLFASDGVPSQTPTPAGGAASAPNAAQTSSPANAATNPSGANAADASSSSGDYSNRIAPTTDKSGRQGLFLHVPAPSPQPADTSAATNTAASDRSNAELQDAARRADEAARRLEESARRAEEFRLKQQQQQQQRPMPRPEDFRLPPPSVSGGGGMRPPPPPQGRRPYR